jgi:hypothetical protein
VRRHFSRLRECRSNNSVNNQMKDKLIKVAAKIKCFSILITLGAKKTAAEATVK